MGRSRVPGNMFLRIPRIIIILPYPGTRPPGQGIHGRIRQVGDSQFVQPAAVHTYPQLQLFGQLLK